VVGEVEKSNVGRVCGEGSVYAYVPKLHNCILILDFCSVSTAGHPSLLNFKPFVRHWSGWFNEDEAQYSLELPLCERPLTAMSFQLKYEGSPLCSSRKLCRISLGSLDS
jgi:hypothetical protein